ncbi:MAG: toll/interleukin-1 receptor domain-containing protein [Kiritimatiellae bacterium]|nr:toll/interleukin-1 receptor domain-containing protein [Kiritimatiellia bacterium]
MKNGRTVNQFIRRMGTWLENCGKKDWVTVKNGVDEIYRELIMPPVIRTPEQELRLREGTSHLVQSHPERGYVFVSYSTKDRAEAENVRGLLESSGVRCWMAPRDIPAGTNYAYVIERAISNCAAFLLLISRNSVQSVWVNKEVLYALGKLQSEGRFHASWLSEPFNLEETGSGMAFALQDVQIDGQNLKDDVSGILLSVLLRGLRSSDQVPISCWVNAVVHHPEWANNPVFASRCPWSQFFNHDWQLILKAASRAGVNLESVIPFEKLTPTGWANLLAKAPSFSTYCEKWAGLTTDNWLVLLRARPEFADKCGIWPEFSSEDWERLLRARPELDRYRKQPDS